MTIGEYIREYRKMKGLTQKELADKVGLATGTIQQYELNKRAPNVANMKKISNVLDLPYRIIRTGTKLIVVPLEENRELWQPTTQEERKRLEEESDRILLKKIKSLSDIQQAALNVIIEGLASNSQDTAPDPDHQNTE